MDQLFTLHTAELLLWLVVLAGLVAVAAWVLRRVRAASLQQEPKAVELLVKFRESQRRGELSDEEFRTIKTNLAQRLQDELKDEGDKG